MVDHPAECELAAASFRATFVHRDDAGDLRELERLTAWAHQLCRSRIVRLEFADRKHGPNLRLVPMGRVSDSLFQIYNYHHGNAKSGVGIYLYSQSHARLSRPRFRQRWWHEPYPEAPIQRLERIQAGASGMRLEHPADADLADATTLLRLAAVSQSTTTATQPFTPRNEHVRTSPNGVWTRDPDKVDRGTAAHRRLENELARIAREHHRDPLDHARREWDLAWLDAGTLIVVEVKSLTAENEARQLRLGLGQLLDYASAAVATGWDDVRPILAVEGPPSSARWVELCKRHGVGLVWPETFDSLFD